MPGRVANTLFLIALFGTVSGCAAQSAKVADPTMNPQLDCSQGDAMSVGLPSGCSSRANLRAMVADPRDLDIGQPPVPATGEREARAVEAYRLGKAKALGDSETPATPATPTTPSKAE